MASDLAVRAMLHVWDTLEPLELPMAVMGGLCMAAWEHPRFTKDVDLLVALGDCSVETVVSRLRQASVVPKREPPILQVGELQLIQLVYEPPGAFLELRVDLLLARSEYHLNALSRRVIFTIPGTGKQIAVLACEDLIILKLLAGRVIDRVDVANLLRANRPVLDFAHLGGWIGKFALQANWAEAWEQAFPGEPVEF